VIVPALAWIFSSTGYPGAALMHAAVGTSLATIVVTSISSVISHHRRGAVRWRLLARVVPGLLAGAVLGAAAADHLPTTGLEIFFGCFAILLALQFVLVPRPAPHRDLPGRAGLLASGAVIGLVSTLVGIGGGNLMVPFLTWCNVAIRNAVATAAAGGLPIALVGSTGFVIAGLDAPDLPAWSGGYVYWPAVAGITVTSVCFAPLGAKLAHTLPGPVLKRVFAVFLAAVGVRMLLS